MLIPIASTFRSFFATKSLYLGAVLILLVGIAAAPMITGPDLPNTEAFTGYLNGSFPTQLPSTWQWSNAYTGICKYKNSETPKHREIF